MDRRGTVTDLPFELRSYRPGIGVSPDGRYLSVEIISSTDASAGADWSEAAAVGPVADEGVNPQEDRVHVALCGPS